MRKLLLLPFLLAGLCASCFGSVLIFKGVKEIPEKATIEIATIDVSRYKQLRFVIWNAHEKVVSRLDYSVFSVMLTAIEGEDKVGFVRESVEFSFARIIDVPPPKIRLSIEGKGIFKIFIWGQ